MKRLLIALTLASAMATPARAQTDVDEMEGTVAGNGTSMIERLPEVLRVQVDVFAKGKDLKQSLAKLKKQRAAAEKQLAELGAEPKSVHFEQAKLASLETDQQKQMRMMVRQRMRQGPTKRPAKKPDVKPPVVVAIPLSAEWSLAAGDGDEMMLASSELEEKIKAADLAGLKVAQEQTAEEQELAEEMEAQDEDQMDYYNSGRQEAKPGEPVFLFACRITDDERDKALAEAFTVAKAEAARLAKAAGAELGRLKHLVVNMENSDGSDDYETYQGMPSAYRYMQRMRGRQATATHEAIGMRPGPLKYHVVVTATFAIK
jgi:uncharacterized protein YggE